MICTGCNQDKPISARGLCSACYAQWQRKGTTERVRVRGLKGKPCIIEGCDKIAHGRGLCHMHLKRERLTGTTADPRIGQPPPVTQHPLYPQWIDFQRARNPRPVIAEWKENFEVFLAGVGTRPSKRHRLYRMDKTKPMGPGNFEWRLALVEKEEGEGTNEYNKRYRRAHKDEYGTDYHDAELRRKFGITFYDYRQMMEDQNGLCAISGALETVVKAGRVQGMAVDHDHATGAVRQLLTGACNIGLGLFNDDPSLLTKAILYLAKHAPAGGQQMIDDAVAYLQRNPVHTLEKTAILPQSYKLEGTSNAD